MKFIVFAVVMLAFSQCATAYETGSTPIRLTVNPCSVFTTEAACMSAGCNWCNNNCQSGDCATGPSGGPSDKFNITITIQNNESITNIGEMKYSIYLENNNSYLVKGTLWTWVENSKKYNTQNISVFVPAMSNQTIEQNSFLMLVPGEYRLVAELVREPSGMIDRTEVKFNAQSATGFPGTETRLNPTETTIVILFIIMIIIVAFAILLVVTDFYKYLFSEPRPNN